MADQLLKVRENAQILNEALSPQDKKVVDAFYFSDKPMTGKILKTDGKTLEKTGMGAQTIAKVIPQSGGKFKVVAKMDGRSTQEIVNYIKKTFPKQLVTYEEVELDEAKYQVNYSKNNKLYSKTINARNEDDAEEKAIKKFKITDDDIRSVVKEETLDEGRMKELAMKIAQVYSNMKKDKNMRSFADKFRKDVAKSLDIRKSLEKVLPDYVAGKDITNIMSKHVPGHKEEGLDEKVSYVEYKFKNARDAGAAKKYFDAQQRMSFDVNDDNIRGGELMVDAGKNDMTQFHKEVMKKFRPKVMSTEAKLDEAKSPSDILFHFNSLNDAKKFNDYAEKSKQKLGIKQVVHFTKGQDVYASSVSIQPKDGMSLSAFETLYKGLDKIAKKFKSVKSIKYLQNSVKEAKLIDKPTGEVLKTGSKEEMETERKRNRDELQVKEWFKSKNIDVKVRQLDESTQVYVPLGRRIPNEIREELITTQYGKMPEDVKNVKDINYGNFVENSITMNNDFWSKVLHGTKGE